MYENNTKYKTKSVSNLNHKINLYFSIFQSLNNTKLLVAQVVVDMLVFHDIKDLLHNLNIDIIYYVF